MSAYWGPAPGGRALAIAARRAGLDVTIQAHEPEVADGINRDHANPLYLPGVALDPDIRATIEPAVLVSDADVVLRGRPGAAPAQVVASIAAGWPAGVPAVICAKGIELGSAARC